MAAVIALLLRYVLPTLSALPVDRLQGRRSSECHGKDVAVVFSTLPLLSLWPPLLFASMARSGGRNRLKLSIRRPAGDHIENLETTIAFPSSVDLSVSRRTFEQSARIMATLRMAGTLVRREPPRPGEWLRSWISGAKSGAYAIVAGTWRFLRFRGDAIRPKLLYPSAVPRLRR